MPRYVTLMDWTEQGAARCHDLIARAGELEALIHGLGGTIREHLYTFGEHDIVLVTEFPDDRAEAIAMLHLASLGDVRTTTMRAFTDQETGALVVASAKLSRRTHTASRESDRPEPEIAFWPPDA